MPGSIIAMLLRETIERLETMAQAIGAGNSAKCNAERARIEEVLAALSAEGLAGDDRERENIGAVYRAVGRMIVLAASQNDPGRCREGVALLERIQRDAGSFVKSPIFEARVVAVRYPGGSVTRQN